ncbi:30S ribosomal protein S1 [Engelhardtia mirabilis]|uniref:Small ribosomal subunit protein bS1 n=1 Tax=Engelhardtia mirabilis TaxID=2528011 RepID=A0A518BKE5_9BACT|nr:30S ribosomal protein S1 [Planctomycetes bacterium Pla133]QDV01775.1 30S ribosomal protein S1 [Planctomycetes bacterium Pla86]
MSLAHRRIKEFELDPADLDAQLLQALGDLNEEEYTEKLASSVKQLQPDTIVQALVDSVDERTGQVVMDIGGKAEGNLSLSEFGDTMPEAGQTYEVYYGGLNEDDTANISKRRADRQRAWEALHDNHEEGDEVHGVVLRKIKGGLLVDVEGVPVFLPASQVNLRRTHDISDFIGEPIRARIIKIDPERMNVVISRRKLLEEERQRQKETLLKDISEDQVRIGTVKNIADFGVFVDLGGIDGLLHITDMSWGRIQHPSQMVEMGQQLEVKVLRVDFDRERIALGLKQKSASPWEGIDSRYPVNSKHVGEVVNLMTYGAFVKLEDGVEGLVHISEMSWTRRVNHPSELVKIGDNVEVVVLEIDKDKQEISLGMKQAEANPWDLALEKYPPGTVIEGTVRNLTSYGAFIEIEEGIDGLLHVSDMSWTKKVSHPSEVVRKGDKMQCVVLSVDTQKKRIALGLKQLSPDPWLDVIPSNYHVGDLLSGYVTKITNFGVFVKLEEDLEGLLHISELSDHKITSPEEIVKPGMKIEVRVIRVDIEERKIGLSFVHADFDENAKVIAEAKAAEAAELEAANAGEVVMGEGINIEASVVTKSAPEADAAEAPAEALAEAGASETATEEAGTDEPAAEEAAGEPEAGAAAVAEEPEADAETKPEGQ